MTRINLYSWGDVPNWGDRLSYNIADRFFEQQIFNVHTVKAANLIGIGSVLEHIKPNWKGIVAGSGKLRRDSKLQAEDAIILSVRGPLSAKALNQDIALGDPGLLAEQIIGTRPKQRIDIGILPHWADTRLKYDSRFYGQWNTTVINPFHTPFEVIHWIASCKKLVTSSLHGCIVADAFGIPRRFEPSWRMINDPLEGGSFKHEDYNASVGLPFRLGELQTPNPNRIQSLQDDIVDVYTSIIDNIK